MLKKKLEKSRSILLKLLLVTIISNTASYSRGTNNNKYKINNNEELNNNLSFEDRLNNKDRNNKYLRTLQDNCYFQNNIRLAVQYPANDIAHKVQQYSQIDNTTYTLSDIIDSLWKLYSKKNTIKTDILQGNNNIIQQSTNILKAQENLLSKQISNINNMKNINQQRLIAEMKKLQQSNNKDKKSRVMKLFEKENDEFSKNIESILSIKNQYEDLNYLISLNDIYFKVQKLLLCNPHNISLAIENKKNNIFNNLTIYIQTISENINSFYESCLLGYYPETTNDKINVINNTISILTQEPKQIEYHLKTINDKIHEISKSPDLKVIKNDLQIIYDRIAVANSTQQAHTSLQHTKDTLSNLLKNINTRSVRNSFSTFENNRVIMPTTNNIFLWVDENYEDWTEQLDIYETEIINTFKLKLNKKQIKKEDFENNVKSLYKISVTTAKIENYHRTANMLKNLHPFGK